MNKHIPLSVPSLRGNEWKYIKECLDTEWVSSAGKYVEQFEKNIASYTGSKFAVACVNGTSALQLSLRIAGIDPGDEVIVPSLTFIAPVNAIKYNNSIPIFMDSDNYCNIDTNKTIEFINRETYFRDGVTYNKISGNKISGIIPVHVWGNAVQLDDLIEICDQRNINVIEDASESLGTIYSKGQYAGKHTGTIGKIGCLSFNGNKIITTGGGGMILTDNENLAMKAQYLSTQAKDDPVRYIHNEIGYNFRLTNIQAALGVAQLEKLSELLIYKREIHDRYCNGLEDNKIFSILESPDYATNNHWLNIIIGDKVEINKLIYYLSSKNIETRPIWHLNHLQKPYSLCQAYNIENAVELANKSLCIPSSANLKEKEILSVVSALNSFSRS